MNSGLTDLYIRSLLAVGPKLYAGTDSQGVFIAESKGASWTNQRGGLPNSSQVFDLAIVNGTIFAGLYSKGLYRWEADLQTWVKSEGVVPLEIVTAGDSLVVGHNPGGIFVSEDRGTTWLDGNSGLPRNAPTWTLAADAERVWLGTSGKIELGPEDIGLFVSKDRGKSWTRSDAGLPPSSAAISFMVAEQFILVAVSSKQPK
jgi:ligand-binding sensor domain-containing protein